MRCEIKNIVLTTDLSEESKRAFDPTVDLARRLGIGVTLLHVVHDLQVAPHGAPLAPAVSSPELEQEMKEAKLKLGGMRDLLPKDLEIRTEVLVSTNVAGEVAAYAKKNDATFIAVSTHGRTGLRRLVLGSVAEAVLRCSTTPVICFPMKSEGR